MKADTTPFLQQLNEGRTIKVNNGSMNVAIYNLIISKRDLGLWKAGMKPHRHWRVTDVKKYFGLKGHDKAKLVEQINELLNIYSK